MGRTNDIMVTNDGATILKSLYVDNPAAKVLVGEPSPLTAGQLVASYPTIETALCLIA